MHNGMFEKNVFKLTKVQHDADKKAADQEAEDAKNQEKVRLKSEKEAAYQEAKSVKKSRKSRECTFEIRKKGRIM